MNQEAFVVLGCDLIYKKYLVVRVLYKVQWNLCGRENLEFDKNKMQICDYQWFNH